MLARRLLILIAVLMGLTALTAGLAPREQSADSGATPTPAPPAQPSAAAQADTAVADDPLDAGEVGHTIDADEGAHTTRVEAHVGERLRITVEGSDVLDSVELGDNLDVQPISPEAPAKFELLADTPGDYPITLVGADRRVGRLVVTE
jgi:hypothetical protein